MGSAGQETPRCPCHTHCQVQGWGTQWFPTVLRGHRCDRARMASASQGSPSPQGLLEALRCPPGQPEQEVRASAGSASVPPAPPQGQAMQGGRAGEGPTANGKTRSEPNPRQQTPPSTLHTGRTLPLPQRAQLRQSCRGEEGAGWAGWALMQVLLEAWLTEGFPRRF